MTGFNPLTPAVTVAGVDVGGDKKGCHLVILRGQEVVCNLCSRDPKDLLYRCQEHSVQAVGIDSPCKWRSAVAGRPAERAMAKEGVFCFSTPTRERALENQSGFYRWMFNGEEVYAALTLTYPLLMGSAHRSGPYCFETFPHAVTCSMLGTDIASAKKKRVQRRQILAGAGIDTTSLKNIDAVDAALCALTAGYLLAGKSKAYGEPAGGYIFVPAVPGRGGGLILSLGLSKIT